MVPGREPCGVWGTDLKAGKILVNRGRTSKRLPKHLLEIKNKNKNKKKQRQAQTTKAEVKSYSPHFC